MVKCPNCGRLPKVQSTWEVACGNRFNVEYICCCGCHWVNRYDLISRDVINNGSQFTNETDKQINTTFKNQQFQD